MGIVKIVKDISTSMPKICQQNRQIEKQNEKLKISHPDGIWTAKEILEMSFPTYVVMDKDDWIAIDRGYGAVYDFNASEIQEPIHLIKWIHHLTGKNWMTQEHIHQLIETVCHVRKWKIY